MKRNMRSTARITLVLGIISALGLSACETGPAGETSETANLVWPAAPDQPRVTYLKSWSTNQFTLEKSSALDALLGETNNEIKGLIRPYGVHVDKTGRIFVTDTAMGRLVVFDEENRRFDIWGESGRGTLLGPIGVTSDDEGHIYVTDPQLTKIIVFDGEGNILRTIGSEEELTSPTGIAVSSKLDRIFVADTKRSEIVVYDLEGNYITKFGHPGDGPGEYRFPTNIVIDKEDRLYVTDTMNFRVQVIQTDGTFINEVGGIGDTGGSFSRPKGVAIDSDNNIYVVDAAFGNFQIFNQEGDLLLVVGEGGADKGQFILPAGAFVDDRDRIYIVDQMNHRVQVFQSLTEAHVARGGS